MSDTLWPFISFFGGKWRAAKHYPPPVYNTIVEPFAGSAGYSLRYPDRRVVLVEKDPKIAAVWRYLTTATEGAIGSLPILKPGQSVDEVAGLSDAEGWLIGFWLNKGAAAPSKSLSAWGRKPENATQFWGEAIRARIAGSVHRIRHWEVIEGDYKTAPDVSATWFVDPPYQEAGTDYVCGSDGIDYDRLGQWCRARVGQVVVCEADGADWLPFHPFMRAKATHGRHRSGRSNEAIWTNYGEGE